MNNFNLFKHLEAYFVEHSTFGQSTRDYWAKVRVRVSLRAKLLGFKV